MKQPWYKNAAVWIITIVLAILGTLAAVFGKGLVKKKQVEDEQKDRNTTLDARLHDKAEVAVAKLETVNAETAKAESDAKHEHEEKLAAIKPAAIPDSGLGVGLLETDSRSSKL